MGEAETARAQRETLDDFIGDLRAVRELTGLSYRAIAVAIGQQREAAGASSGASQIAHTTVSDAFRLGRQRINPVLVGEIAQALGLGPEEAQRWRERCVAAMASRIAESGGQPVVDAPVVTGDRAPRSRSFPRGSSSLLPVLAIVIAGVLLNSTGKFLNPLFGNVFFLDMIGTAVVAITIGPWWAASVGAIFAVVELSKGNVGDALFATTMITSGLLWGYGASRWNLAGTLRRFLGLSVLVALMTSALAVPITVLYFGGTPGRGFDGIFESISAMGVNLWLMVGLTNLAVSVVDKLLTGAIAFYLTRPLRKLLRPSSVAVVGPA